MLSPALTLSPEKPSLADSALLSLRANAGNVNFPDAGNNSFQENLDRQISDQQNKYRQRSDQQNCDRQNSDRLDSQQSVPQDNNDRCVDETAARAVAPQRTSDSVNVGARSDEGTYEANSTDGVDAREKNIEQKVHIHEPQVHKNDNDTHDKKPVEDKSGDKAAVSIAGVVLQKQTVEAQKITSGLTADGDSASALSASDAAITALIDSRERGEKMTLAWKKGEPPSSGTVLANAANRNGVQSGHHTSDTKVFTSLADQLPDSKPTGDNKKSPASVNETTNITALITSGSDKTASTHDAKTPTGDVSTLMNQLNLAMGTISASTKMAHSVRLNPTDFANDSVLTSQNVTGQPSEASAKAGTLAATSSTALTPASTNTALSSDFVSRLGEQVMWLRHQQINVAELRLHPRDLGSVLVRIDSSGDNTSVNFVASHHTVRDVLDQNMIKLHELFSDAGLNLVHVNVSSDSPSQQQGAMPGSGHSADYRPSSLPDQSSDAADSEEMAAQGGLSAQSIHLVDFFA